MAMASIAGGAGQVWLTSSPPFVPGVWVAQRGNRGRIRSVTSHLELDILDSQPAEPGPKVLPWQQGEGGWQQCLAQGWGSPAGESPHLEPAALSQEGPCRCESLPQSGTCGGDRNALHCPIAAHRRAWTHGYREGQRGWYRRGHMCEQSPGVQAPLPGSVPQTSPSEPG